MLLKSLDIQGFKSFPDKIHLSFEKGITAVVGPNGSGKSNISDAIRWVLGEQSSRSLRGAKMEDVIFSGTSARKQLGFAEVTLTIDNTQRKMNFDSDEVAVTRRYYRSGESEYQVNKAPVRLKDIHEMFMDTGLGRDGYSIIGQGRIAEIVSARSEDRREIFEEAAGISKLRYRKEESEKRLEAATENMLRIRDILSELESRLSPLKEQSEKAQAFLVLSEEKKEAEIGLWLLSMQKSKELLERQNEKIDAARAQYEGVSGEINLMEQRSDHFYEQMQQASVRSEELRRKAYELDEQAVAKLGEVAVEQNTIEHLTQSAARVKQELDEIAVLSAGDDGEIAGIAAQRTQLEAQRAEKDGQLKQLKAEMERLAQDEGQTRGRGEELRAAVAAAANESAAHKLTLATVSSNLEHLEERLAVSTEEFVKRQTDAGQFAEQTALLQKQTEQAADEMESVGNVIKGHEYKINLRKGKLDQMEKQLAQLTEQLGEKLQRARVLEDMERHMEGFANSVKTVLSAGDRGMLDGVHGPVSKLIKAEDKFATAIETALGAAMQNIVVENEENAKAAIEYLKRQNGGRSTFLPLTAISGSVVNESGLERNPGFAGVASELVSYDKKYENIVAYLLGRVIVAEDMDAAVNIARKYRYRYKVVTLDGQVVNAGGSMTGGSVASRTGLLSRGNEIKQLRGQITALEEEKRKVTGVLEGVRLEYTQSQQAMAAMQAQLTEMNLAKVRLDSQLSAAAQAEEENSAALLRLTGEKGGVEEKVRQLRQQRDIARDRIAALDGEIARLSAEYEQFEASAGEIGSKVARYADQITALNLEIMGIEKDMELLDANMEHFRLNIRSREERLSVLHAQQEEMEAQKQAAQEKITLLQTEGTALKQQAAEERRKAEDVVEQRLELEKKANELRGEIKTRTQLRENLGREHERLVQQQNSIQAEYDRIISGLWDEYELTRSEAERQFKPVEDRTGAQKRVNEIKNKIKALGSVNLSAIEEYKEVAERHGFLSGQVNDIEYSRAELEKLIEELTAQMRSTFAERFEEINREFKRIFTQFFRGGSADLRLTDPGDVLGCGIEIIVQPPGKVIKSISLLSGGEQAFVAIAIYFAILSVRPSPFCVLDEIEAALDDANVGRFAQYLRGMADRTQFIAITHRRGTMEEADVLYGVTMQEEGVSRLLKIQPADIERMIG